jgi:hypothetical protein
MGMVIMRMTINHTSRAAARARGPQKELVELIAEQTRKLNGHNNKTVP